MFFIHYLIPLFIFYLNSELFWSFGLVLGNLIDLDHVYYRMIGEVGWFQSACNNLGEQCSIGFYPLHHLYLGIIFLALSSLIFMKAKKMKFIGIIFLGAFLNIFLDYIHLLTGFGF